MEKYPQDVRATSFEGSNLLHLICEGWPPSRDAIEFILDIYPESAKAIDHYGVYPFYWCANNVREISVLQMLLDANPLAIQNQDNTTYWGQLPLHRAVSRRRRDKKEPVAEVVNFVAESFPAAVNVRDKNGMSPLDIAIAENVPTETISILQGVEKEQQSANRIGISLMLLVGLLAIWWFRKNCLCLNRAKQN